MKRHWATLLVVALLASGCNRGQEQESGAAEDAAPTATAGVDIAEVILGRAIGPDKAITSATNTFTSGDTIYASVRTEGAATSVTLSARWTYEDGQLVDESSQTIAPTGPAVTEFHVSKPDGWPSGRYEVAISLDGQPAETRSFTVEGGG